MAQNNLLSPNSQIDLINNATIYINKNTVQFGREVYQFHNITGFGVTPIKNTNTPWILIIGLFMFGILLFAFPSSEVRVAGFVSIAIGVVGLMNNLREPINYGFGLYLNSGQQKIFVTPNKDNLNKIVQELYDYMNDDNKNGTYVVNIVRGNVHGNYIGGNGQENNMNFK